MPKENVVSFRLDDKRFKALKDKIAEQPIIGVKSANQLARKIVCDFVAGRLTYPNPEHANEDVDLGG
jgi:hypothetical protein